MTDLKQAYETLGLPENASREDVEKAFDLQLRKSRKRQQDADGEESEFSIKLKAYKQIVEYEDRLIIQGKSQERYSKWGKFSGTAEKVDDFFRLYKFRVIISVIALIVLIVGINAFINHREEQKRLAALPPIDLSVLYIGNFITNDNGGGGTAELEKAMIEQFPEFKRFSVNLSFLPPEGADSSDFAYRQKAMAILATERPDIYIVDKSTLEWIGGGGGVLQNLDTEAEGVLKPLLTTNNTIKTRTEDDTTDHIYGIDVSNSPLFNQLPLSKQEAIITVGAGSKNFDKAIMFIQKYLEGTQTEK